jgi:hypothetical protein
MSGPERDRMAARPDEVVENGAVILRRTAPASAWFGG